MDAGGVAAAGISICFMVLPSRALPTTVKDLRYRGSESEPTCPFPFCVQQEPVAQPDRGGALQRASSRGCSLSGHESQCGASGECAGSHVGGCDFCDGAEAQAT